MPVATGVVEVQQTSSDYKKMLAQMAANGKKQ
jgi:hypothetical protein